eukprot:m51a1_g13475 hypothetical protein (205) ;mRNA; f:625-2754
MRSCHCYSYDRRSIARLEASFLCDLIKSTNVSRIWGTAPCSWNDACKPGHELRGVNCFGEEGHDQHITAMRLGYNLLSGTIPPHFPALRTLCLDRNRFAGEVPRALCSLRVLAEGAMCDNPGVCYNGNDTCLGQTARIVMLKVLPGRSLHMTELAGAVQPTPGYDSHSSPTFSEWFLFDETQCCPTHVIEVQAISNKRTGANDV